MDGLVGTGCWKMLKGRVEYLLLFFLSFSCLGVQVIQYSRDSS